MSWICKHCKGSFKEKRYVREHHLVCPVVKGTSSLACVQFKGAQCDGCIEEVEDMISFSALAPLQAPLVISNHESQV